MPHPTVHPGSAAESWLRLKSRLREARDKIKPLPTQWHYNPSLDIPREQAETHWLQACERYRIACDDSVEIWLRTASLEEPTEEIRYFLSVRFDVAHELVSYLTFVRRVEWTAIVPFPSQTDEEVLRSLLIAWWEGVGQFRFFERAYDHKMMP